MALPLYFLKDLQMRKRQKLGLASVLCLAVLIVSFDIIRTIISVHGGAVGAQSALWCVLEATIAVIVSCLPTYRSLFASGERVRKRRYIELVHQARAVKCQPSVDFNCALKMEDSVSKDYARIQKAMPEYDIEESLNAAVYLDEFDSVKVPEAVHFVGVRSEYVATEVC